MTLNETLVMVAIMLAPAFFSLLGLAGLGSPMVAVLGEMSGKASKRVFFDKYGQQTGTMGLILTLGMIVVYAACAAFAYMRFPEQVKLFLSTPTPFIRPLAGMAAYLILGTIYFLTWKKMRQAKAAHMSLGFLAAAGAICFMMLIVPLKLAFDPANGTFHITPELAAIVLPITIMYVVLTIGMAAALSCVYLVLRRNKDDFGRDYYKFSLPLAARWSTIPMIGFLGCQGWLYTRLPQQVQTIVTGTPLGLVWLGVMVTGSLCVLFWLIVARSERPMQLKVLIFATALLLWIMHALNVTLFSNFMLML